MEELQEEVNKLWLEYDRLQRYSAGLEGKANDMAKETHRAQQTAMNAKADVKRAEDMARWKSIELAKRKAGTYVETPAFFMLGVQPIIDEEHKLCANAEELVNDLAQKFPNVVVDTLKDERPSGFEYGVGC